MHQRRTVQSRTRGDIVIDVKHDPNITGLKALDIYGKGGNMIFNASYRIEYIYIDITKNSINNMGDIVWNENFTGAEYRGGGDSATYSKIGTHTFKGNYDEVKNWFLNEYPKSPWRGKNWTDVKYIEF